MSTKICTSLEQSKKLIELGIDRKTSDMYYWCGSDLRIGGYKAQDEELDIPAWSLTALLIILSEAAFDYDDDGGMSLFSFEKKWHSNMYDCPVEYGKEYDEPIDSVFEMVCRAFKYGIIKNEKI